MLQRLKKQNNKKGFTLVELIIVIAIIGILAAVLVPTMIGVVDKANASKAGTDLDASFKTLTTLATDFTIDSLQTDQTLTAFAGYVRAAIAGDADAKQINTKIQFVGYSSPADGAKATVELTAGNKGDLFVFVELDGNNVLRISGGISFIKENTAVGALKKNTYGTCGTTPTVSIGTALVNATIVPIPA